MKPVRIQRKRTKGWKMPPNTVYVGRPSKWGNPIDWREYRKEFDDSYDVDRDEWCRQQALDQFRINVMRGTRFWPPLEEIRRELRGKNLACWCRNTELCHADVLLELANEVTP